MHTGEAVRFEILGLHSPLVIPEEKGGSRVSQEDVTSIVKAELEGRFAKESFAEAIEKLYELHLTNAEFFGKTNLSKSEFSIFVANVRAAVRKQKRFETRKQKESETATAATVINPAAQAAFPPDEMTRRLAALDAVPLGHTRSAKTQERTPSPRIDRAPSATSKSSAASPSRWNSRKLLIVAGAGIAILLAAVAYFSLA